MSVNTPTSCMLVTGEYFDYLAPDPAVITLDVLGVGLERMVRFNGQTTRAITAAEHSLRVRRLARAIAPADAPGEWLLDVVLASLLHDAHEPLVPWGDCLRPGKTPEMRAAEERVDEAILLALLPGRAYADPHAPTPWCRFDDDVREVVKAADTIALYFEALLWQPGAVDWAPDLLGRSACERRRTAGRFEFDVDRILPLIAPRPGECWRGEVARLIRAARSR